MNDPLHAVARCAMASAGAYEIPSAGVARSVTTDVAASTHAPGGCGGSVPDCPSQVSPEPPATQARGGAGGSWPVSPPQPIRTSNVAIGSEPRFVRRSITQHKAHGWRMNKE